MGVSGIEPGTELNQTYRVDALIGVGGMGEVFRGHNVQTGDLVAIKIVLPEYAHDDTIIELFRKEARILNHLAHDAIVRYYVFTIDRTLGRPYLAMEYVDGPPLSERLRQGALSEDEVDLLRRRLADGLSRANSAGVIHRDISPDNVILPGGSVANAKIIDFGIARTSGIGGGTLLGGSFAGKYNWVSPEQLGLFGGDVTQQSDIYSLGLVLAAALRGRAIDMNGTQVEVIEKRRIVPPINDVPARFQPLLAAMLEPDPARRLKSMTEVRDFPLALPAGSPAADVTVIAAAEGSRPSAKPPARNVKPAEPAHAAAEDESEAPPFRLGLFASALAVAVLLGVGGGWLYVRNQSPAEQAAVVQGETAQTTPPAEQPGQAAPPPETAQLPQPTTATDTTAVQPPSPEPADVTPPPEPVQPPKTEVAALPPKAAEPPPDNAKPDALDLSPLRRFVQSYDGGGCFHADVPPEGESKAFPVYAGSQTALDQFGMMLKASALQTAAVEGHVVKPPQCAVIETLDSLNSPGAAPLRIAMENEGGAAARNANGKYVLEARLINAGPRNVSVLLVSDDGGVQNINRVCSRCLSMEGDVMKVRLPLQQPPEAAGSEAGQLPFRPVLIIALASPRNLLSISAQNVYAAADVLPALKAEVGNSRDVAAAVGYFRLPRGGT